MTNDRKRGPRERSTERIEPEAVPGEPHEKAEHPAPSSQAGEAEQDQSVASYFDQIKAEGLNPAVLASHRRQITKILEEDSLDLYDRGARAFLLDFNEFLQRRSINIADISFILQQTLHYLISRKSEQRASVPTVPFAEAPNPALRSTQAWQSDRQDKESPADFIARVYAPWIGKGLTRADIRRLDKPLYVALASWLQRKGNELAFDLPTKKEVANQAFGNPITVPAGSPEEQLKELERVTSALRRRVRGGS
jgi:hypothetical protein